MQINQQPLSQPIPYPLVQGDPATRVFGLFLLGTLAMITLGAIAGIAAGNIAHYKYFGPTNSSNTSINQLLNLTIFEKDTITENSRLWLPLNERLKRSHSSRKIRHSWSLIEKPANNRRW